MSSRLWTLRDALDIVAAWQPPPRCAVRVDCYGAAILLGLVRTNGCKVTMYYPRSFPAVGIVDQLNMMAVDMEADHICCCDNQRLTEDLRWADMLFAEAIRRVGMNQKRWKRRRTS